MVMRAFGTLFMVLRYGDLPTQGHLKTMHRSERLFLALLITLQVAVAPAQDQPSQPPLTRMLFVMDASNSMNAFWGNKPKIATARELLLKSLEQLQDQPDLELALRLYGHQTPIQPGRQDCNDTRLEVPFSPNSIPSMRRTLEAVRCVGTTPIARSLEQAAADFPERGTKRGDRPVRNVIILITDGIEACDEDPCAVSRALQAKGIVLKPFVIGVGLGDTEKYALQCVGNYFDASTPELFEQVLQVVVTQALNSTTAQISLMTTDGRPAETDVPVSLYDQRTGKLLHHLMHTMNERGLPDTLSIDPIHTYRLVAHTLPPSVRENVTVKPGQHTIIAVDAGTGLLDLRMGSGPPDGHEPACVVRRSGQSATLNAQPVGSGQRYRVGTYDLEVLTLPRTLIPDVTVAQGITTPIIVPRHGVLNITTPSPGPCAVLQARGDELVHVVDLDPTATNAQIRLQPGSYSIIYRSQGARHTELTMERTVTIESSRSTTLTF
jgi:Ca-activated chloride channel family protein